MITWQDVIDLERDVRELEPSSFVAEESEQEARARMTEAEQEQDDAWLAEEQGREEAAQ